MDHVVPGEGPLFRINFTYGRQHFSLTEWTVLFTLCLAPLIAHLIAGAPQVVFLHDSEPKWHDSVALYNPISIIWRYLAIFERGICTKGSVTPSELAAFNVVYWTNQGWDASEPQIRQGQLLCVRKPPGVRERIFSSVGLKTLIVSVQGVAAVGALLPGRLQHGQNSLAAVFLPLAFLGLLRLPAAYWLTDDFHIIHMFEKTYGTDRQGFMTTHSLVPLLRRQSSGLETSSLPLLQSNTDIPAQRYQPRRRALLARITYFLFLMLCIAVAIYQLVWPIRERKPYSLTQFWLVISYFLFTSSGALIFAHHLLDRRPISICHPSMNRMWYKIYTGLLIMLAVICCIIAALETKRELLGTYTSYPLDEGVWTCEHASTGEGGTDWCFTWTSGTNGTCHQQS